jgi:hypothetical protein
VRVWALFFRLMMRFSDSVAGPPEHCNEPSCSINDAKFLDSLSSRMTSMGSSPLRTENKSVGDQRVEENIYI